MPVWVGVWPPLVKGVLDSLFEGSIAKSLVVVTTQV